MNAAEYLKRFSGNIILCERNDFIYIMDSYRLRDGEYDFGVYDKIDKEDFLRGKVSALHVPYVYWDGWVDFILKDDFKNHYKLPEAEINKLDNTPPYEWYETLVADGYESVANDAHIKETTDPLRDDWGGFDAINKDNLTGYLTIGRYYDECIDKYEDKYREEEMEL